MTYIIRVDPSGDITECDGTDLLAVANAWFPDGVDVVTLAPQPLAPPEYPQTGHLLVGCVAQWGRLEGAVANPKAWALYGRSPIVGVCFVAHDADDDDGGRVELPAEFVDRMRADWVRRPIMNVEVMRTIALGSGVTWPT